MKKCKASRCPNGATMGIYCIQHWYQDRGQRPPVNTPTAIAGRQETSRKAAERIAPKAGSLRAQILDLIRLKDGLTRDEIEELTGIRSNTVNPRLKELADGGWIMDSRLRRKTRSGSDAIVWVSCD